MRAGTRKYVLLVPDGAADLYREGGRSPLGLARTPFTDFLAREGVTGRMRTFYPDLPRESMVAQLGMLGWDPRIYYPHGRSSCELLALRDVYLGEDDLAFRANLVRMEGRTLASYSASCIASADARPLVERVDRTLRAEFPEIELYPNSDFRNTLVVRGARVDPRRLVCPEPHEHQGEDFDVASLIAGTDLESCALAARINAWLARAATLLEGEPANALFPWSASRAFRLPSFAEISGFTGRVAIVGFMDFLLGIARAGAIDFFRLGNGRPDTDFRAKGAKVVELLAAGHELVVCHVNAPDEASHLGDLRLKIQCLEAFDRDVVGPVVEYFRRHPEELGGVMVAPDHYTNHALEGKQRALAHSLDPAPFCLWNGVDRDGAAAFDEDEALGGRWGREPVSHLDLLGLLGVARSPERRPAPAAPIAIVGIGCRFPGGVDSPESFWRRLCEGFDGITEVPADRFDLEAVYAPRPGTPGRMQSRNGGFLGAVDAFDAAFFGISPREAPLIDPQQRLLLEVAWEALEDAGVTPARLPRSRSGVFLGMMSNDYEDMMQRDPEALDSYGLNGAGRYGACGRLSFFFGLEGPSLCVDTACSSSLVSVHLACQSLRLGECDLALAGGSHLLLQPHVSIALSQGNILSPDGRCKFADARADGFGRGEGVGLVVLKRLDDALADGDRIWAVLRGSAVNSDGATHGSMASPSVVTQQAMLREAYRAAGIAPGRVRYVEAHGTGTVVGDRVELEALSAVLAEGREPGRTCRVGSVKTNIGHTEGASGVAGLIKLALCVHHRTLPPSLHCETLNPSIPWESVPLEVQRKLTPWPEDDPGPAVGGVNSFSLSGINAHIVVEEPPRPATTPVDAVPISAAPGPFLVPLSARHPSALRELAAAWLDLLRDEGAPALADLAWTAALRRAPLEHRLAAVARTREELRDQLTAFLAGEERPGLATGLASGASSPIPADAPLDVLARLWCTGAVIAWERIVPAGRHARLPSYPWQRERFWLRGYFDGFREEPWSMTRGSHPLLGPHVAAAAPAGLHLWESTLAAGSPFWLDDHRIRGAVLLPAAAYVEMGLAAAGVLAGAYRLEELRFDSALVLAPGERRPFQVVLAEEVEGGSLRFFSRDGGGGGWTLHAGAAVRPGGGSEPAPRSPAALRARCGADISGEDLYRDLSARGLEYGPAFRGIERLWRGEGEAVARVLPPPAGRGYRVHPAALDTAFQLLVALLTAAVGEKTGEGEGNATWVPVGLRDLASWRPLPGGHPCWAHAVLRESAGEEAEGDLALLDEAGGVLLEARGLRLRRLALSGGAVADVVEEEWSWPDAWAAEPAERFRRVEEAVRRELAAVLRLRQEHFDEPRTLTQLGLDSLMALQLKGRLQTRLGASLPVARLLQGLSLPELVEQVLEQVAPPLPAMVGGGVWEEIEL